MYGMEDTGKAGHRNRRRRRHWHRHHTKAAAQARERPTGHSTRETWVAGVFRLATQ